MKTKKNIKNTKNFTNKKQLNNNLTLKIFFVIFISKKNKLK